MTKKYSRIICEHKFAYGGVRYVVEDYKLAGSNARPVIYFEMFFCEKCLYKEYHKMPGQSTTYENTKYNATPRADDD
jgi:hypothetical protein